MPVRIRAQLDNVECVEASAQKRSVIVVADTLARIDKLRAVTDLLRRLPNNVLQPGRTHLVAAESQVLISHNVEQDGRLNALQFIPLEKLRHKVPAAVGVIG